MNRTSPVVKFGQNAIATKDDIASITCNNLQSFSNVDDLETGIVVTKPYATYEPDFWLLDGNYKFLPSSDAHPGWISEKMTEASTNFAALPVPEIVITFNSVHSTTGLRLKFFINDEEYVDSVRVVFYNASDVTINDETYSPNAGEYFISETVANFKKILVALHSTNNPYRYARLLSIEFDEVVIFSGENVKAAHLIENINPLSDELTVNTLDLTLFSADGDFSITDPIGIYANLQYKEPLDVWEVINGLPLYIGRFYLDEWHSETENLAKFQASDAIGLLDKPSFIGGLFGSPGIDSEDLIADIMEAAGLEYTLDASLHNISIVGDLGLYPTCRDALQQVCFYIGAYVTCARSQVIQILPLPVPPGASGNDHTLTSANKGISSPVELKPLITGVEIHERDWYSDEFPTGEVLYEQTLGTGDHTVVLGEGSKLPSSLVLGGTATYTLTLGRYYYYIVNVTGAGSVKLTQNEGLTIEEIVVGEYNLSLPTGAKENIIVIRDATIIRTGTLPGQIVTADIAERVYDYYQRRYVQKTKLFASQIVVGESVLVDTQSAQQISGIVELMKTDLANGFVSEVEIVGIVV